MKLKLSTLLVIIAILFFFYYYFGYMPCVAENKAETPPSPQSPPEGEIRVTPIDGANGEFFSIHHNVPRESARTFDPNLIEGFNVTPIDYREEQVGAGNIRPDNVMMVEEPITFINSTFS